ncbi:MAG: response regulator [Candidatus Hydrogenedentes bacterium]|nr:response regulator [Candidatus Hydrogenedentota bacterium]
MNTDCTSILVVDDEAVIRDLITEILTDEGYEVEAADDGVHALERLKERPGFDMLFTDIMMPEMDGIELIRKARQISPDLIPIVMTGYATLETARAAVREGAYDYVLKPFSLSEVKLAVDNAFERYRLVNDNARLRDLTQLFRISETIAGIHDEGRLLEFVLGAALEHVGATRGSIMLTTEDGQALQVAISVGLPDEAKKALVPFGKGIAGWVAEHNLPLCIQNIQDNPELRKLSRQLKDHSFISLPLDHNLMLDTHTIKPDTRSKPHVIAVLNVSQKKDGFLFTDGDLKALSIVAKHASVALENVHLLKDLEKAHLDTLTSMALVLEAKDPYTHGHSERVRNYSVAAGIKLGMSTKDIETLRLGAMLHDVGKIGVSDAILNKVEPLTDEEWEAIKLHPVVGYDVLEPVGFLTPEHLALVRSHHERLDGSGYPDGLRGGAIDDRVRVLAVADTYDAMSGDRAYRKGLSVERILEELRFCAREKLDPDVAALFIHMIESGEIHRYRDLELKPDK